MTCRSKIVILLGILGTTGGLLPLIALPPRQITRAESDTALEQIDPQRPCGVICVTVAGGLLGHPIELSQAKQVVRADGLGRCSMADVIDGLHHFGFSTSGVRLQSKSLERLAGVPTILYVNQSHFMVVMPVGDGSVVVVDPPRPVECIPAAALLPRWQGEAILVRNSPDELRSGLPHEW